MEHFNFKGDSTNPQTGRARAKSWFPVRGKACEVCGTTAMLERHHKDNNPLNNDASNIAILCRYHHMIVDGRIHKPERACVNCGKMTKVVRKGRCGNCSRYFYKNHKERPEIYW